ncbi:MAG: acyl-CoA thioesterase [Oscillatoriales cyanobacterium SM2_1_8]|nr:acyl-CoA thioesterase [Oscillatoriales cyanobacterium SM2_1_8]
MDELLAPGLTVVPAGETWFRYNVRVQPHDTDYSGHVWHGASLRWLEAARVECLRSVGMDFADLVRLGIDLPVVSLETRYHQPLRLGDRAMVLTRLIPPERLRLHWEYRVLVEDRLCLSAWVTLVTVDRPQGKVFRAFPVDLAVAIAKLNASFG